MRNDTTPNVGNAAQKTALGARDHVAKMARDLTGATTKTEEFIRAPGESASAAFDRVAVRIRELHRQGFGSKVPCADLRPGKFTLEARDGGTGWNLVICEKLGGKILQFSAA